MAATYHYPQSGEPAVIHFDMVGRRPPQEHVEWLTGVQVKKKPVSGAELKEALKWFALGVGFGIAAFFFGRWVIGNFRGLGVLFFGYGFAYLGAPGLVLFGIISLGKIFRSAQKKKPEAALRWVYEVAYMGDDASGERFGKPDYAVATLARIMPDDTGFEPGTARAYILNLRESLARAMDVTTAPAKNDPPGGWHETGALKSMVINGTRELCPGVVEMDATLTYKDILSRSTGNNNNTVEMIAAALEIHITSVLVRAGQYWYPYDVYPAVTCRQVLPQPAPAEAVVLPGMQQV